MQSWRESVAGRVLRSESGAQLLEFALGLPFLLVLLVGLIDFGGAYNTRHILTNAARDAARISASNPQSAFGANCANNNDCAVQAAADAVQVYLQGVGMMSGSSAGCLASSEGGSNPYTYSCGGASLSINRAFVITGGAGGSVTGTQVTLSYPYTWTFGKVVSLLGHGSWTGLPTTITTTAVMQNLVSN